MSKKFKYMGRRRGAAVAANAATDTAATAAAAAAANAAGVLRTLPGRAAAGDATEGRGVAAILL